jgi:hypothetical protein
VSQAGEAWAQPRNDEVVEAERHRLGYEVEAARLRIDKASGVPARSIAARELGAMVLAAADELAAVEREHQDSIDTVRASARDEAARILAAARDRATVVHARAAELDDRAVDDGEHGGSEE